MLVLTERSTRMEIIRKMPDKSQTSVRKVLDKLEKEHGKKKFSKCFKTITVDNGSEFLNSIEPVSYTHLIINDLVSIHTINYKSEYVPEEEYQTGVNIIVGGNSLGRGITFPMLQTVYYCRTSKNPQADTMWQHARMFGYDRNKELVRVYMPGNIAHLFTEINAINNAIFVQIKKSPKLDDIKVFYPKGINPTRKNVLDKEKVGTIVGGVNYFPNDVSNNDLSKLDAFLEKFTEQPYYEVHPKMLINLLGLIDSKDSNCCLLYTSRCV